MAKSSSCSGATLDRIRGSRKAARANARTVAALTDNPGCTRRRVIDAAAVRTFDLAKDLGEPVNRLQSPFAITSGNRFEYRLKKLSNYELLVEAIAPFVELPKNPVIEDLGLSRRERPSVEALKKRAERTAKVLGAIARGDKAAPHIVDHPVLAFDLAGTEVFLEPDALAFRIGTKLELVEIKSYAIIDGQADPSKVASTSGQAAVYVIAIRATLVKLGLDSELVSPSVILVAPRNFGRAPTAHRIPLKKRIMALERVLRAVPKTDTLLEQLEVPADFTLDVNPDGKLGKGQQQAALGKALKRLPMHYVPECLSSCDLGRICRQQAIADDEPSRLGRSARDNLAGVDKLHDALRLATHGAKASEPHLADLAETLRNAHGALGRARKAAQPQTPSQSPRKRAAQ